MAFLARIFSRQFRWLCVLGCAGVMWHFAFSGNSHRSYDACLSTILSTPSNNKRMSREREKQLYCKHICTHNTHEREPKASAGRQMKFVFICLSSNSSSLNRFNVFVVRMFSFNLNLNIHARNGQNELAEWDREGGREESVNERGSEREWTNRTHKTYDNNTQCDNKFHVNCTQQHILSLRMSSLLHAILPLPFSIPHAALSLPRLLAAFNI